jgi:hypothetical protein
LENFSLVSPLRRKLRKMSTGWDVPSSDTGSSWGKSNTQTQDSTPTPWTSSGSTEKEKQKSSAGWGEGSSDAYNQPKTGYSYSDKNNNTAPVDWETNSSNLSGGPREQRPTGGWENRRSDAYSQSTSERKGSGGGWGASNERERPSSGGFKDDRFSREDRRDTSQNATKDDDQPRRPTADLSSHKWLGSGKRYMTQNEDDAVGEADEELENSLFGGNRVRTGVNFGEYSKIEVSVEGEDYVNKLSGVSA